MSGRYTKELIDMQLKPCPFCGSTWIHHYSTYDNQDPDGSPGYSVECQACQGEAYSDNGIDDAIYKWNRRASDIAEEDKSNEFNQINVDSARFSVEGLRVLAIHGQKCIDEAKK